MKKVHFESIEKQTRKWFHLPDLPNARHGDDHFFGAAVDSHRMVIIDEKYREPEGKRVLLYDNRNPSMTWISLPNAPGRSSITAVTGLNGTLFVLNEGGYQNEFYSLDVNKQKWSELPPTNYVRNCCSTVALGNYVYTFGGFRGGMTQRSVERLDTIEMKWEALPPMFTERAFSTAGVVGDNKIIVTGGVTHNSCGEGINAVEVLDTTNLQWSSVPSLPVKALASAAVSTGQYLVITGGVRSLIADESLDIAQIYDIISQAWTVLPAKMLTGRARYASALFSTGQLVVAGGGISSKDNYNFNLLNFVEGINLPAMMMRSRKRPFVLMS